MHAGIPPPTMHLPGGMHPPGTEHAGRYGQRTGGMHPTGMQSCYHYQVLISYLRNE